ncbi:reverse transcriptase domain, reverse transcriptase zinc-binding domain protein [Tanacetum coccineum]
MNAPCFVFHIVWFTHAIPRHAFQLWLIMRRSLKTQDKLRQWDVDPATDLTQSVEFNSWACGHGRGSPSSGEYNCVVSTFGKQANRSKHCGQDPHRSCYVLYMVGTE